MRIYLKTTPSIDVVDYNHWHLMVGVLHKWIGQNSIHDKISNYSFSQLNGAKSNKQGLVFVDGAGFFISSWESELIKKIVAGVQEDPTMFAGMKVSEIVIQEDPDFENKTYFQLASPVFIQRKQEDGKKKFYFYDNEESSALMEETLRRKMDEAGLPSDDTFKIYFDQAYVNKKTSKINYKKGKNTIENRASWCPVIIEGSLLTKQFVWNVGVGNSTGIGFGSLK